MTIAEFRAKLAAIEVDPLTGARHMAAVEQLMAEAIDEPPVKRNTRRQRVRSQRAKILRRSIRVHVPDPRFAIAVDQLAKAKITADDIFDHLQTHGIENPETGEIRDSLIRYVSVLNTQFKMLGAMALLPATAPPALALPAPKSEEDRRREAREWYDLTREALGILEDLGVPLQDTLAPMGVETTAQTVAEFMPEMPPEPETIDVTPAEPAPESKEPEQPNPPKNDPIESF
jgi:hypothetical protein